MDRKGECLKKEKHVSLYAEYEKLNFITAGFSAFSYYVLRVS